MERIKLVVVIPVGPTARHDYVRDTIESILHYTAPSRKVIILDDSGRAEGQKLQKHFPDIAVLKTQKNYGKDAGLYVNLSMGFEFAVKNYDFDVILKLDADGLIIGPEPEKDAIGFFRLNPDCGIIGSYKTDCNGDPRDFSPPEEQLMRETSFNFLIKNPHRLKGFMFLRKMVQKSKSNGYKLGEHCMGGAYFISKECVTKLYRNNLLSRKEIHWSRLGEDQIFGLLIYSLGLKHGDFATGSLPLGVRWQGLPCPPEELLARGKKITHSTRFYNDMTEAEIRRFFAEQRHKENSVK